METFLCIVCVCLGLYLIFRFWKISLTLLLVGIVILAIVNWETTLTLIGIIIGLFVFGLILAANGYSEDDDYGNNRSYDEDRNLSVKKSKCISKALQHGDWVDVYDMNNQVIFSRVGRLYQCTGNTVSIKNGHWIDTYDADGNQIG